MKSAYSPTEKLDMLTTSAKFVIPESADGPPEAENLQRNKSLLDTPSTSLRVMSLSNHGSRPPQADSSGMTFGADFHNF